MAVNNSRFLKKENIVCIDNKNESNHLFYFNCSLSLAYRLLIEEGAEVEEG